MNRYLLYRRVRGPIFLLTFGLTALLAQWDVLSFSRSWPIYLIVAGLLRLVENATFAPASTIPATYPGTGPGTGTGYGPPAGWEQGNRPAPGTGLATVSPNTTLESTSPTLYTPIREEER